MVTISKMDKKTLSNWAVIIFLIIIFFLIAHPFKNLTPEDITHAKIAGQNIKVDLALDEKTQERGLSGRESLGEKEGMLFIFPHLGKYYFWMKGMNFPIDMIWIGEDQKVIYIKKDARPENFLETYGPDVNTKYVLEVNAGFADKFNLKEGDSVIFTY